MSTKFSFWIVILVLACPSSLSLAEEDKDDSAAIQSLPNGRHRLDLGFSLRDAVEGNILVTIPAYSLAISRQLRVMAGTSLVYLEANPELPASSLDEPTSSGLGDSLIQAQYSPGGRMTASAWIPDNVGLSGSLLMPTGDPEKGLSADTWEFQLGLGWSYNAVGSLWLIPAAYYLKSFNEGALAIPAQEMGFSLELRWLFDNGIWFGYRPNLARDMELEEWADDHLLVLGKMFGNGFGIGLEYGRADRLDQTSQRDDYVGVLNLYYQFGRAP